MPKELTPKPIKKGDQLGNTRLLRGMKGTNLYAFDPETGRVYLVPLKLKATNNKKQGTKRPPTQVKTYRADVDPKHPVVRCLNMKNAKRKFSNLVVAMLAREVELEKAVKK
jgi:hypothetical protein